jgi:2-polyprenyl-6-methoxyphenol hydroxylase-like FAD-dependent oxidoreductase
MHNSSTTARYLAIPKLVVALPSRHGRCVLGEGVDAIRSFNPVYAQGMTVAAMDALALRDALQGGDQDLQRRFFATAAKGIGQARQIAVGSDLALPEVKRARTVSMRRANVYTEWALAATESNRYVAGQFWKVMNTVDVQTRLLRPSVMLRVAITNVRRSPRRERRMRCSR